MTDVFMSKCGNHIFLATPVYQFECSSDDCPDSDQSRIMITYNAYTEIGFLLEAPYDTNHGRVVTAKGVKRIGAVKIGEL
jgi:hypothetical protein